MPKMCPFPRDLGGLSRSHADDGYGLGMRCEGGEVVRIGGQYSASRFGMRHDQRVDRGAAPSTSPQQGSTSRERLR